MPDWLDGPSSAGDLMMVSCCSGSDLRAFSTNSPNWPPTLPAARHVPHTNGPSPPNGRSTPLIRKPADERRPGLPLSRQRGTQPRTLAPAGGGSRAEVPTGENPSSQVARCRTMRLASYAAADAGGLSGQRWPATSSWPTFSEPIWISSARSLRMTASAIASRPMATAPMGQTRQSRAEPSLTARSSAGRPPTRRRRSRR